MDIKIIVSDIALNCRLRKNKIAIGFGRTPISKLNEIRLAARVNIWADAEYPEQLKLLTKISDGHEISITIK